MTAIYLVPRLLTESSHLLGTAGQASCPPHGVAPDRVYIIKPMSPWAGCALTAPFHPYHAGTSIALPAGGISLLHLSWGHPRRALPVILALWSPDFPHVRAFRLLHAAVQSGRTLYFTSSEGESQMDSFGVGTKDRYCCKRHLTRDGLLLVGFSIAETFDISCCFC